MMSDSKMRRIRNMCARGIYGVGEWPDKLRSIAWITQIPTVAHAHCTRTHALLNVKKIKRYKTITIASRAVPESSATCDTDHATRSSSNPSPRACATRAGRRSALYTMKPKKLKACRRTRQSRHGGSTSRSVSELGVSPLSPVPRRPHPQAARPASAVA